MLLPKVSVIMAVRDGERWLEEACRSVLSQSLSDIELIVIDDGSTDGSVIILETLSESDPRLRWQSQPPAGLVAALNRGLSLARAPLLARLDADDIAVPSRLAEQSAFLGGHPDMVLLGSWAEKMDAQGRNIGRLTPESGSDRLAEILQHSNPFVHSSVMMRTDGVRELRGYRAACLSAEDYDLWLRLSERGRIGNLPRELVRYRVHTGSVTRTSRVRQCFSTRLARRAAAARRAGKPDPIDGLTVPPDWWADDALDQFYGEDAALSRFLDLATPEICKAKLSMDLALPKPEQLTDLSHAEKVLARRALRNLLFSLSRPAGVSAVALIRLFKATFSKREFAG